MQSFWLLYLPRAVNSYCVMWLARSCFFSFPTRSLWLAHLHRLLKNKLLPIFYLISKQGQVNAFRASCGNCLLFSVILLMNSAEQYFYGLVVLHVSLNVKCDWLRKGGYFLQHLFTTCKMQNEWLNYGFQGMERGNVCFLHFLFLCALGFRFSVSWGQRQAKGIEKHPHEVPILFN